MTQERKMMRNRLEKWKKFSQKMHFIHRTFLKKTGFYFTFRKKVKVIWLSSFKIDSRAI